MSKDTPEWRIELADTGVFIKKNDDADFNWTIAEVLTYDPGYLSTARLIAAAPELLEVCKRAENLLDQYFGEWPYVEDFENVHETLVDAIARAEGEEVPA